MGYVNVEFALFWSNLFLQETKVKSKKNSTEKKKSSMNVDFIIVYLNYKFYRIFKS